MPSPRFRFHDERDDPSRVLLVDGTAQGYRSLSHWPGNATPEPLKRDTSTGIALAWAALAPSERRRLAGDFEVVANNHYDTDGVLSVFAVLRPEAALPRRDALLAAAEAGDFAVWRGPEALAVDLTILAASSSPESPVPDLARAPDDRARWTAAYVHWIEHLPELLDDPFRHRSLIEPEFETTTAQLEIVRGGAGLEVQRFPDEDLGVVTTRHALGPVALHEAVGDLHRVLVVHPGEDGPRYAFAYRDESWFELVEKRPLPLPRVPLEPLRDALQAAERAAGGAGPARWWCEGLARPVTRLGFGAGEPPEGFFLDLGPGFAGGPPSRLRPAELLERLREHLAGG